MKERKWLTHFNKKHNKKQHTIKMGKFEHTTRNLSTFAVILLMTEKQTDGFVPN